MTFLQENRAYIQSGHPLHIVGIGVPNQWKRSGSERSVDELYKQCSAKWDVPAMNGKIQLLVFHLNERYYSVRLSQVERVIHAVDITPLPQAPDIVLGVIDLRGMIVPVLNIRERFGFTEREIGINDQMIIAHTSRRTVALVVDAIADIVEHPEEDVVSAERICAPPAQIEGVIQLQDGLALIYDLDRFLSLDEEKILDDLMNRQLST